MMIKRSAKPVLSEAAKANYAEFEAFLNQMTDFRPATIRNYLSDFQQFMAWFENYYLTDFFPEDVSIPALTEYRRYLQHDLGRKPTAINRYLVSLKRYFAWAKEEGLVIKDPAKPVKLVKEATIPHAPMSDRDEHRFIAAVQRGRNLRDITLVTLMLHTGLRVGEVCELKWDNVVINPRSGHLKVWGKQNKFRQVPLNITVRRILNEYKMSLFTPMSEYVFLSSRTKDQLTPRAIGFLIKKYAIRADLKSLRPHDLRHRFGYRMAKITPLYRLAQIMGHDSLNTTMIYVQATKEDLQSDVEGIAWE